MSRQSIGHPNAHACLADVRLSANQCQMNNICGKMASSKIDHLSYTTNTKACDIYHRGGNYGTFGFEGHF